MDWTCFGILIFLLRYHILHPCLINFLFLSYLKLLSLFHFFLRLNLVYLRSSFIAIFFSDSSTPINIHLMLNKLTSIFYRFLVSVSLAFNYSLSRVYSAFIYLYLTFSYFYSCLIFNSYFNILKGLLDVFDKRLHLGRLGRNLESLNILL